MQKHYSSHRSKTKTFLYLFITLVTLVGVTPALADYLGPNRTVTETTSACVVNLLECQYVTAKKAWKYKVVDSWPCSSEGKPWQAYPSNGGACNSGNSGSIYWERVDAIQPVINTYPSATINSFLQNCTLNNGWCTTPPTLALNGYEPVAGYNIIAVEGTLNGKTFACQGTACNVDLLEGDNNFAFWSLSSWGDSSTMGTLYAKVDSQSPRITGTLNGISGSNGWYLGPVSVNSSASDSTSGIASFTCTLDDIALGLCSPITISGDGPHTLVLAASDNAGNVQTLLQNASIDTQNPSLTANLSGTAGSNSWYTSAALNASASDPTPGSGISILEYNLDDIAWITFPASGQLALPDGRHSVAVRALDIAGRTTLSTKLFWLDSVAPSITLDPMGDLGNNNWYVSNLNLQASASDDTSGIDLIEYTLNNNTWTAYTTPLILTDGSHTVSFWAQDKAGLVTQVDRTYQVDTRPPQIAGSIRGTPGINGWYVSDVTLSASSADPLPGSGMEAFTYILNASSETPYTSAITLSNGQHSIILNAKDKAGLSYSTQQTIKVDTIHPSLNVQSVLPGWIKNNVALTGTASDSGSGLSKLEISTDGGQTWQAITAANSWNYDWNTRNSTNGLHNVHVRVSDTAGLTTEKTFSTGVDNRGPNISMPDSWYQWDTVVLDAWDNDSGLSEVYVEISDPDGRWKKRVIELDPEQFPLSFKWDRRFGDGTVAPLGTYDIKVLAYDKLENETQKSSSIKILLGILPAGPTATPQLYIRSESTPTPAYTATSISQPTSTPTAVVSVFGVVESPIPSTPTLSSPIAPRTVPTQTSVLDWLESVFTSPDDSSDQTIELASLLPQRADSRSANSQSNVLWGAAAAAMVGSVTAYAFEERRRLQEEKERSSAAKTAEELRRQADADVEQAAINAMEKEERQAKRARKIRKMEAARAQEEAWEAARQEQAWNSTHLQVKVGRLEAEESKVWIDSQIAVQQKYIDRKIAEEEKKKTEDLQAGLAAYYSAMRQGEQEAPKPEPNWWDKTKSFVSENIIQPVNTNVYQPYIKPAVEVRDQALASVGSWLGKNYYEPFVKPALESAWQSTKDAYAQFNENVLQPVSAKVSEAFASTVAWTNEKVFQPFIKPWAEHNLEVASKRLEWINDKIYQPYLQPGLQQFNENFIQPYVTPLIEKAGEEVAAYVSLVNKNIYQPIFEPVVKDIKQYLYQPVADKVSNWWDQYGEWVHGALDAAGFIPGLGDIGDGLNGLLYLAEGHYIEASVSALAMIPLLGDLAKAGKWGLKIGAEVVEEVVEEVAEKVVKETIEEVVEQVAKEVIEETSEKVLKETGEELVEQASKTIAKETLEEAGENLAAKTIRESLENSAKRALKEELIEDTFKEAAEDVVAKTVKNSTSDVVEKSVEEVVETVSKRKTQVINALVSRYGDRATQLLEIVDPISATKLLKFVGEDVIKSAINQGDEVVEALSHWSAKELKEHGPELLARANRDAKALSFVKKLLATGPIDVKNLTLRQQRLIKLIAGYSTQNLSSLQVVLGKWVDINGGFVKRAVETGALHYNPHPDIWKLLKAGVENTSEVAWLVNKEVVQKGITKTLPFEYSLNGIADDLVEAERQTIKEIFSGNPTDDEIIKLLELDYKPVRIQEIQTLKEAGYQIEFDNLSNSFKLTIP